MYISDVCLILHIMKIVFYAGYQNPFLSPFEPPIGGTELALQKVSAELSKFGHEIIMTGDVDDAGIVDGVLWIPTQKFRKTVKDDVDIIISASYMHFLIEFSKYKRAKKILWAHNTDFYDYHKGKKIKNAHVLPQALDLTICLTEWHKSLWERKYFVKPEKISVIGNGIDETFFLTDVPKVKNQFIWSSAPERGLPELLDNWLKIRQILPNASLKIFTPSYAMNRIPHIAAKAMSLPGVDLKGSVGQKDLHAEMSRSDFWCYVSDYEETYCITALEMQRAGVVPIVNKKAGLLETVNAGYKTNGVLESDWAGVFDFLASSFDDAKDKIRKQNLDWVCNKSWFRRAHLWNKVLKRARYESN